MYNSFIDQRSTQAYMITSIQENHSNVTSEDTSSLRHFFSYQGYSEKCSDLQIWNESRVLLTFWKLNLAHLSTSGVDVQDFVNWKHFFFADFQPNMGPRTSRRGAGFTLAQWHFSLCLLSDLKVNYTQSMAWLHSQSIEYYSHKNNNQY